MSHRYRLSEAVSIRSESGRVLAVVESTDSAHVIDGPALEVLELVVAGAEPVTSDQRRALDMLIMLGVVVPADQEELSRRRVVTYAGGAALGVVSLLLPASQVAASYQGYGGVLSTGGPATADNLSPFASSVRLPVPSAPSRPTAVRFTIEGGAGADSTKDYPSDGGTGNYRLGDPGRGAIVQATFQLAGIDTLLGFGVTYFTCYVGGRGGGPTDTASFGQGTYSTSSAGYNVGTNLGSPHANFSGGYASNGAVDGGGGGAATLIYPWVGGSGADARILMVAGGGGGGGAGTWSASNVATPQPGGRGGDAGRNGQQGGPTVNDGESGTGGGGGTTSGDGGSAGAAGTGGSGTATAGSGGTGGNGATRGGAGGGGWRGGGGGKGTTLAIGGSGAGGGGGSSWIRDAVATGQYYGTASVARGGSVAVEWFYA